MAYETSSMSRRTITAFFDDRTDADEAVEALVEAGFDRSDVRMVAGAEGGATGTASTTSGGTGTRTDGDYARDYDRNEGMGFWDALKDLFLPDEDRSTYAEGLRRGGYLVTVTTADANYDRALDILDDEGTIDIDERAESWKSEGWTGYRPGSESAGTSSLSGSGPTTGLTGASASTMGATPAGGMGSPSATSDRAMASGGYAASDRSTTARDESIPIVEEQLNVGKREVGHGRVRVRSYVVETPVNEEVSLRDERVSVERRPVDRALGADEKLFQDRTIEAEEHREEAVVSKQARVKEEVTLKKDVDQRTETVSDTVRRTEVEVDDDRSAGAARTGKTGATPKR